MLPDEIISKLHEVRKEEDSLLASVPSELFSHINGYKPQNPEAVRLLNHLAFGERTAAEAIIPVC